MQAVEEEVAIRAVYDIKIMQLGCPNLKLYSGALDGWGL